MGTGPAGIGGFGDLIGEGVRDVVGSSYPDAIRRLIDLGTAGGAGGVPPLATLIQDGPDLYDGDVLTLDLPPGHLWDVTVHGTWQGIDAGGGEPLFSATISCTPTGLAQKTTATTLSRALPGRREQYVSFRTFGPCDIAAYARGTNSGTPTAGSDPHFDCAVEAVWVRLSVEGDPT